MNAKILKYDINVKCGDIYYGIGQKNSNMETIRS